MGIAVEKKQGICVYGTDENYGVLCAASLCHPGFRKGAEDIIEFAETDRARVCVGDVQIVFDCARKKCANNRSLACFGTEDWGEDVRMEWSEVDNG